MLNDMLNNLEIWFKTVGIRFIIAVVVLIFIFKVLDIISSKIVKKAVSKNAERASTIFIAKLVKGILKVIVFLFFLGYVGVQTAGLAAAIGSIGLAIGLAIQGSLANFAGGIIIIVMRPFKADDFISSNGFEGVVEEIKFFYTYLRTPDNKVIMIPNGTLANNVIINFSAKDYRRLDMVFSISYNNDFNKAIEILKKITSEHAFVVDEPESFIRVGAHNHSSIDIVCNVWVKRENYLFVKHDLLEAVKIEFDKENIEIPYNKLDVNIFTK